MPSSTNLSPHAPSAEGSAQDRWAVRIDGLKKRYGDFWALERLDLQIRPGELFGFLGPNGAGKTTTLSILAGLLTPTEGTAKILGYDVVTQPVEAKRRSGYIPDRPYVYEKLTGNEFIEVFADLYGVPAEVLAESRNRWLETLGISAKADEWIESYSHGMRQRLVLAASLIVSPEVLIIDEPMVGLDPQGARLFKRLMREHCDRGGTVLMSTHSMAVAQECCDRIAIMSRGQLVAVGTVDELRQQAGQGDHADLESIFFALTERD